jgi:cellulose synthase/poly-beta-1,6-N-acetylglucosamine synthase-like glycosyltransferase
VTIYDAEDRPDPLQLRRAVAAFKRLGPEVACLQAKLSYHNAEQNIITRWFTAEYALWFGQLLPGLVKLGAPVPLGGTSNHFRREILLRLGGWDPYNVTEDADLGVRLHRLSFRTGVLESTTYEEANSDFVNWTKQRSRWYKGYLQTWLVHMRHPRLLLQQLGVKGFIGFNLFVGGTPFLAMLNPVFWALTAIWFLAKPPIILELFPAWLYYTSLMSMVFGNFVFLYTTVVGARAAGQPSLTLAALVSPAYWVMMSIAVIKALVQLFATPTLWEKTAHGLDRAVAARDGDHVAA